MCLASSGGSFLQQGARSDLSFRPAMDQQRRFGTKPRHGKLGAWNCSGDV